MYKGGYFFRTQCTLYTCALQVRQGATARRTGDELLMLSTASTSFSDYNDKRASKDYFNLARPCYWSTISCYRRRRRPDANNV